MIEYIRAVYALGHGVFPCAQNKRPAKPWARQGLSNALFRDETWAQGPLATSKDREPSDGSWIDLQSWPSYAYGLVPGPRTLVIDIDTKPGKVGGESWAGLCELHGGHVPTMTTKTPSGGFHLFYELPEGVTVRKSESQIGKDLDVRGNARDGYVLGPGSPGYVIVSGDQPPVPAPDWLVKVCQRPEKSGGLIEGVALERPSATELKRMGWNWRKRGDRGKAMAAVLGAVLEGEPYARPGVVYTVTRDLAYWISGTHPLMDPEWFASTYLEPSWLKIWEQYEPGRIDRQWPRVWADGREKHETEKQARVDDRVRARLERVRRATGGARTDFYSQAEIADWAERAGVDVETWRDSHLIVECEGAHFVFFEGDYVGPIVKGLGGRCEDLLAPIRDVDCERWDKSGERLVPKSGPELVREYGCTVDTVRPTLGLERSYLDGRIFYQAVGRMCTDLVPERSEAVERWYWALTGGGEAYERLLDWIAVLGRADMAAPAVWFLGGAGRGKSLFANGLARLWGRSQPVGLDAAMGRFNGELAGCPLVFGDEHIPTDSRGRPDVETLKTLISGASIRLERKGVDALELRGPVRLILAANNEDMLKLQKNLTAADVEALGARLIVIEVPEDCPKLPVDVAADWLSGDTIAKHALWLGHHREVAPAKRFACQAFAEGLGPKLLAHSDLHAAILDHVARVLVGEPWRDGSGFLADKAEPAVRVLPDGRVGINAGQLSHESGHSRAFVRRVSTQALSACLGPLCEPGRGARPWVSAVGLETRPSYYRILDQAKLRAWVEHDGGRDWQDLADAIAAAVAPLVPAN